MEFFVELAEHDEALLDLLQSDRPNQFYDLLDDLFSEEKEVYTRANSFFKEGMKDMPEVFFGLLVKVLDVSNRAEINIRCSTLLSRFLADSWPSITAKLQGQIKAIMVKLLRNERNRSALKIHFTCISRLADILFPKNEWPELVTAFSESLSFADSAHAIFLGELIPIYPGVFKPFVDDFCEGYKNLIDQNNQNAMDKRVRAATVAAALKLILNLGTPSSEDACSGFLSQIIREVNSIKFTSNVLEEMISLARLQPRFFTTKFNSVVQSILSDEHLKMNSIQLGIQFLVVVAKDKDHGWGMYQNLPSTIIVDMLTKLLVLLVCVKDNESCEVTDADDTEAGKLLSLSCYAEEAWSMLTIALGGKVILENSRNLLAESFEDGNWERRYAAVTAVGLMTPGCSKMVIMEYLKTSMKRILELVRDDHPCVSKAAIHAVAEFAKYLCPDFQEIYHEELIPVILGDFTNSKIQTHAATALLLFIQTCSSNVLVCYEGQIINKLLLLLQEREKMLIGEALAALAALPYSNMDEFQALYDTVISQLQCMLETAKADSDYILLARTLKCIAVIAVALNKSMPRTVVEKVAEYLIFLQEQECESDTVRGYLLLAWAGVSIYFGAEFLPVLRRIQPARTDYLDDNRSIDDIERSSLILKEKFLACNTFGYFAFNIEKGVILWFKKVLDAVVYAMESKLPIPDLFKTPVVTLSENMVRALAEALVLEPSIKFEVIILDALVQILQIHHPDTKMATLIVKAIWKVVSVCFNRRQLMMTEPEKSEDVDKLYALISDCLGSMAQVLKTSFFPLLDDILPSLEEHLWRNAEARKERKVAYDVFVDIVKLNKEETFRYYQKCASLLVEAHMQHADSHQKEIAVLTSAVCEKFGGKVYEQQFDSSLSGMSSPTTCGSALFLGP